MRSACPFWSRVAVVNGITLALCSAEDLERQCEREFGELEGYERQKSCVWRFNLRTKIRYKLSHIMAWKEPVRWTYAAMPGVSEALSSHDYDTAWTKALEWAELQ